MPIVSKGDKFVFAQVIKDVVEFLGLTDDTAPQLSPDDLKQRYKDIIAIAVDLVRQMPDDRLVNELPNRPRSWRVLLHHVFQIPTAFLDMEETGETLSYENMVAPPPEDMTTSAAIADFGDAVNERFSGWAERTSGEDFSGQVPTYFGSTTRHEMLERTVWHSTQHVRQVASLLEQSGITPAQSITPAHIAGLPLTDKVWDEASA
ncbi:MAG: DinB family protein [Pseudomonadota bacterium]